MNDRMRAFIWLSLFTPSYFYNTVMSRQFYLYLFCNQYTSLPQLPMEPPTLLPESEYLNLLVEPQDVLWCSSILKVCHEILDVSQGLGSCIIIMGTKIIMYYVNSGGYLEIKIGGFWKKEETLHAIMFNDHAHFYSYWVCMGKVYEACTNVVNVS